MQQAPLALTMGDPAGIGGEIAVKAWRALRAGGPAFVLLDDPDRIAALGAKVVVLSDPREALSAFRDALPMLPVRLTAPVTAGKPDVAHAGAIMRSIEWAVELASAGSAGAVVTNPIAKSSLYAAGFRYPGHTEFLGALTGTLEPVMMLACPGLRVVPVTVHVPLRAALDGLSTERILATSRITATALKRDFAIAAPRLAVAGLNPHAGEGGALGREEIEIVQPAITVLRTEGIDARGPFAPDSMFSADARAGYDAAICLYHDQALIPLKTLDMHGGVNVTIGLPIIRTSPDHGTAFDIAGTGRADPRSLIAALTLAHDLAGRRQAA